MHLRIAALTIISSMAFLALVASAGWALSAPPGWRDLCARQHRVCIGGYEYRGRAELPFEDLIEVHQLTIGGIIDQPDLDDTWDVWPYRGDCEDFALSAMDELLNRGWPRDWLSLVVVTDYWSRKPHMVLVVEFGAARIVLDNLATTVYALHDMQHEAQLWQIDGGNVWEEVR